MKGDLLMPEPTATPTRKVTMTGISGAVVVVALWIAGQFGMPDPPPEVVASLTAIVGFVTGYMVPDSA